MIEEGRKGSSVQIDLRFLGDETDQELKSLYDWLLSDPDVRHHADVSLVPKAPDRGAMGDALDLISLVIASGLQLPGLAATIAAWRQTRRERPPMTIESGDIRVVLPEGDAEIAVKIVKALQGHE
ncbi:effector-associated constant component EACC1 [Planotetraspora sp. GP83]|uniref:effector-associated constant component EACC1 n=1 Tax=Planotetraspora sp. GP83 TaxID=3156264 RepID=UPI00351410FB